MNERLIRFGIGATGHINGLAKWIGIGLCLFSFAGNVSPTPSPDKFDLFVGFFTVWLVMMTGLVSWQLLMERYFISPSISALHLALCGVMLLRTWGNIAAFPELGGLTLICLANLIRHGWLYTGRTQPAQPQTTALRASGSDQSNESPNAETRLCTVRMPAVSFADVVGMQAVTDRMRQAGQEVLQGFGQRSKQRNGILLSGKPGNGKTFLAEALAGELKLPFLTLTYGDVASKWIGDTPSRIPLAFAEARAQAPCVFFIDEIDSLLASRDTPNLYEDSVKTVNILLTELVALRSAGVVLVAATNHLDRLDAAAIREGRFDFKIEITPPDAPARRHLIQTHARGILPEPVLETAVQRWAGFSVARIAAVMAEAGRGSTDHTVITYDVLRQALRAVQGRQGRMPENTPTLADLVLSPTLQERVASLAQRMDRVVEIEALGGSVPRGVLFYGPPGTGKTLCARALAKTADWAFVSVTGMDLLAQPGRIDTLLAEASDLRPCVIFIDEAEDVLAHRVGSPSAAVTNKLLAAMDGSSGPIPDVIFIAATNHPQALDAAALRGGRFTEKIEFALPDAETLHRFVMQWFQKSRARLARETKPAAVAHWLAGQSLANARETLQLAVNIAISRVGPDDEQAVVQTADIRNAIGQVAPECHT